jgi:hypothetical protein
MHETGLLHWNGHAWAQVASPNAGGPGYPYNDTTISPASAWAVGYWYKANVGERNLMMHWNGQSWKQVTSPNPGGTQNNNRLVAVAGTSCGKPLGSRLLQQSTDQVNNRTLLATQSSQRSIDPTVTILGAPVPLTIDGLSYASLR